MRYVPPDGYYWENLCLGFLSENHNKYHVGIDLHQEEGKELFRQLVRRADVFVENVRAGTMDRWGLGYRGGELVDSRRLREDRGSGLR